MGIQGRGRVRRDMCIRCGEIEVSHELGMCERCAIATCVEYLNGLERIQRYLAAWAAFDDWLRKRSLETV
jgi:hypothetical protein